MGRSPEARGVLDKASFRRRPGITQDFMTSVRRQRTATRLVIIHHSSHSLFLHHATFKGKKMITPTPFSPN